MITLLDPQQTYTEDDLLRLPNDGFKYELVDGKLKRMPTFFHHDLIKARLLSYLLPVAMSLGFVTTGEAGCRMQGGNLRVPDISFTRRARIHEVLPHPGFAVAAPDLCVEVVSDSEEPDETQRKVQEYFASGATLVWHLLPEREQVTVFTSPTQSRMLNANEELVGGDLLPNFRVRVADLFDLGLEEQE